MSILIFFHVAFVFLMCVIAHDAFNRKQYLTAGFGVVAAVVNALAVVKWLA